jgi:hypothetical protein
MIRKTPLQKKNTFTAYPAAPINATYGSSSIA